MTRIHHLPEADAVERLVDLIKEHNALLKPLVTA